MWQRPPMKKKKDRKSDIPVVLGSHDHVRLSPAFDLVSIRALREALGFTEDGIREFLEVLGVPLLDGTLYGGKDEWVLAASYEAALLAACLPTKPPKWRELAEEPQAIAALMTMLSLIYGAQEKDDLRDQLRVLGDHILKGTLRDVRIKNWRAVLGNVEHRPGEGGAPSPYPHGRKQALKKLQAAKPEKGEGPSNE